MQTRSSHTLAAAQWIARAAVVSLMCVAAVCRRLVWRRVRVVRTVYNLSLCVDTICITLTRALREDKYLKQSVRLAIYASFGVMVHVITHML